MQVTEVTIEDKNENQRLLEQLKYDVFYKKQELEFAIANNASRQRNLEISLELCASKFKISLFIFLFLAILGKIFSDLISVGNSFVTAAFGLIYLIVGIYYLILMIALFYNMLGRFMRWFENFSTKRGKEYCEKKGIFTMSMEHAACAGQLEKQKKEVETVREIEKELEGEIHITRLKELTYIIASMESYPEVPKGKTKATKEEKRKCVILTVIFFFVFYFIL